MPALVSSNWAAWILGFVTFVVTEIVLFMRTPKEERRERIKGNVLVGVVITGFVYLTLFAWSTVQTIYDDHHDSTGRWQAVVKEKDKLKSELDTRPPQGCYMQNVNRKPPQGAIKQAVIANETWVVCPLEFKAPYVLTIDYDRPVVAADPPLFADSRTTKLLSEYLHDQRLLIKVDSPSILPWQGFVISVYGDKLPAPKAVKLNIDSINPEQ